MRLLLSIFVLASTMAAADGFSGQVLVDHTGVPLPAAEVRVSRDGVREMVADLDTGTDGRFAGPDVPPGEYRVEIRKPGYCPVAFRFRTGDAPPVVRMVRYGMISGQVTNSQGQAVTSANISLLAKDAGGGLRLLDPRTDFRLSFVDERGQFRLYNIPPGEYVVGVRYNRDGNDLHLFPDDRHPRIFEIAGGEEHRGVDFVYTAGTLSTVSGKVEPGDKNYAVALTPVDRPDYAAVVVTRTAKDGTFKLNGVPAGSYTLFASGPALGYMQSQARFEQNPVFGKTRVEVLGQDVQAAVSVAKPLPVSFVLHAQGKGCGLTAQVNLTAAEDWGMLLDRTIDMVVDKPQAVNDLAPARYHLAFTKLDDGCYGLTDRVIDLGTSPDKPVTVEIAPEGSIRAKLTGAGAGPGATVVLVSADKDPVRMTLSDSGSLCVFEQLRPGHYWLAAWPAGVSARWVRDLAHMFEIDVAGGAPLEIDLPVSRPEKQQ